MFYMSGPLYFDSRRVVGFWGLCRTDHECSHEEFLTEREKMEYTTLKSINRKREWLSARVALKRILMEVDSIQLPVHCQIEKDRFGCPRVTVKKENDLRIMNCSISHKRGVAAVCLSLLPEMKVGIDVESISEKPLRLRSAFVGKEDSLTGIPESPEYYTVLWACKEAASKVMGLGMLRDFKKLRIAGSRDGRFSVCESGRGTIHGSCFFFRDFIVAVCHRR